MGRWFRRQDKGRKKVREENPAVLEGASQAAAAEVSDTEQVEKESPEPEVHDLVPQTPALAPEEVPGEGRRSFFARFRKGQPCEEPEPLEEETVSEHLEAEAASPEPELPLEVEEEVGAGFKPTPTPPTETTGEYAAEAEETRKGMFRRLKERLDRTRDSLAGGLDRLFAGRKIDAALLEELEELLITADLGVETSLTLIQGLKEKLKRRELGDVERLKAALREGISALLAAPPPRALSTRPWVVMMVGVNGVGKTTTIAKLAHQDRLQSLTPLLIAGDTFRAAAVEQLEVWGERLGAPVIKQKTGADPAAVVFDGLSAAQSRGVDVVYIDTAGRLHTKVNLMEELKKIHRTAGKKLPGAPHEILLVVDATTGQNALSQARLFHEAVGLTGIVLTKLDGTAKGGVAVALSHETGLPLRYIGVGEALEDLRPFDPEAFVAAILG
jgi:fused signal recognition particle receptor